LLLPFALPLNRVTTFLNPLQVSQLLLPFQLAHALFKVLRKPSVERRQRGGKSKRCGLHSPTRGQFTRTPGTSP
jgi:hypothetical protein